MDPNETLRMIREVVAWEQNRTGDETYGADDFADMLGEVTELIADLDEWLTRGGFLPADWNRKA